MTEEEQRENLREFHAQFKAQREAVASLMRRLLDAGFKPGFIDWGEGDIEQASTTVDGLVDEVFATRYTGLEFKRGDKRAGILWFTPYEEPYEVLNNHTLEVDEEFERLLDEPMDEEPPDPLFSQVEQSMGIAEGMRRIREKRNKESTDD